MELPRLTPDALRAQTLGADATVATPFGERPLVYTDYTASGRQLAFVEDYLRGLAPLYANSHTEDSLTGRTATRLLHEAEAALKESLNAGPDGRVVCCGAGSTAAIHKLQEFLGIAIAPATREACFGHAREAFGEDAAETLRRELAAHQPVVFVGPYEHHSNEVTWREGLCEVVEVGLDGRGQICLDDLERQLADPRWEGRRLVGSFSAASNVTGVVAPVREIARALHRHGALALFDYAAGGPYLDIDMTPEGDPEGALDAVFLSPHKFLGGPGAAGVLVFNERLYPKALPPSVGGGGTVLYVSSEGHEFTADVEEREKAGTPGLYQTLRAALAMQVKDAVGVEAIHAREQALLRRAFASWSEDERIEILGPLDPAERLAIVSFNVRVDAETVLHPRFVTVLLNDLFGIQSRAGCSCAGPYGHRLLGIGAEESGRFRTCILDGHHGVKPGWCRVGFHFALSDAEADYVVEAVRFVAAHGAAFLPLYAFDVDTGAWTHRDGDPSSPPFSLAAALAADPAAHAPPDEAARTRAFADALRDARQRAADLPAPDVSGRLPGDLAALQFFALAPGTATGAPDPAAA